MQLRYNQMIGKPVVSADGHSLGRVADLVAERIGDRVCVTALRVGPAALLRRITFRRAISVPVMPLEIPWRLVARVDDAIRLGVDQERAEALARAAPPRDTGPEPPQ